MAIDLSGIQSNVSSLSNIILVTPQKNVGIKPQLPSSNKPDQPNLLRRIFPVVDSFVFQIIGEESMSLSSDITDHFVENNTAIQDNVALKPETISVRGYIGELNNVTPPELELLKTAADRLATLSPFLPAVSAAALIAYNTAAQAYTTGANAVDSAVNTFNAFSNQQPTLNEITGALEQPVQNKQQVAFNKFYSWWKQRLLFNVQTPWNILTNMVILSLRAVQDEETRMITEFEITFKKMRFANTLVRKRKGDGRNATGTAEPVDQGVTKGTPTASLQGKMRSAGLGLG